MPDVLNVARVDHYLADRDALLVVAVGVACDGVTHDHGCRQSIHVEFVVHLVLNRRNELVVLHVVQDALARLLAVAISSNDVP